MRKAYPNSTKANLAAFLASKTNPFKAYPPHQTPAQIAKAKQKADDKRRRRKAKGIAKDLLF